MLLLGCYLPFFAKCVRTISQLLFLPFLSISAVTLNIRLNSFVFFLPISSTSYMTLISALSVFIVPLPSLKPTFHFHMVLPILHKHFRFIFSENLLPFKTSPTSRNLIHPIVVFVITIISESPLKFNAFPR